MAQPDSAFPAAAPGAPGVHGLKFLMFPTLYAPLLAWAPMIVAGAAFFWLPGNALILFSKVKRAFGALTPRRRGPPPIRRAHACLLGHARLLAFAPIMRKFARSPVPTDAVIAQDLTPLATRSTDPVRVANAVIRARRGRAL